MNHLPRVLIITVFLSLLAGLQSLHAFQVKTDNAEVELISEQSAIGRFGLVFAWISVMDGMCITEIQVIPECR